MRAAPAPAASASTAPTTACSTTTSRTTGTGYDSALSIDGGDARPGGALNKHHRVDNAVVVFNTLVDNATGIVIGGNYPEPPVDLVVENNLLADSGDVRQVTAPDAARSPTTRWVPRPPSA